MPDADLAAGLFPALLKHWRGKRGLSQLDLALAAGVSSRHLSFLETGRSGASAAMVLGLATTLDVPLRQANAMLRAAGHAPAYPEPAPGDVLPASVRAAIELLKAHHEPFPVIVIDRTYRVLDVNAGAAALVGSLLPEGATAGGELNLARLTFDPAWGRAAIVNFDEVGRELLWRMQREVMAEPDHGPLRDLLDEVLATKTIDPDWRRADPTVASAPTVELHLRVADEIWSFTVLVTVLQAPLTVALDELRIETWYPNDEITTAGCHALAARGSVGG